MPERTYALQDLNHGFVVAIRLEAKAGHEEELAHSLQALIGPTMSEPGVKVFIPYRSPDAPEAFFVFELYVDEAGWTAHQEKAHFKRFVETMLPKLERRDREPFVPFAVI